LQINGQLSHTAHSSKFFFWHAHSSILPWHLNFYFWSSPVATILLAMRFLLHL
jgi:TRAP-type C4-dicarboxylate transport system permease small subunit